MTIQRMKVYLLTFSFIQNSLLLATNVTCDLSNATIKILIANVTYNLKISRRDQLQNYHFLLVIFPIKFLLIWSKIWNIILWPNMAVLVAITTSTQKWIIQWWFKVLTTTIITHNHIFKLTPLHLQKLAKIT